MFWMYRCTSGKGNRTAALYIGCSSPPGHLPHLLHPPHIPGGASLFPLPSSSGACSCDDASCSTGRGFCQWKATGSGSYGEWRTSLWEGGGVLVWCLMFQDIRTTLPFCLPTADFAPVHAAVQCYWLAQPSPVWGTLDAAIGCNQSAPTSWGHSSGGGPRPHDKCMCRGAGSNITALEYHPQALSWWSHLQHPVTHTPKQWRSLPRKQVFICSQASLDIVALSFWIRTLCR